MSQGNTHRRLGALLLALWAAWGPAVAMAAGARNACELLSRDEVSRVAGGPVEIDPTASGEDDRGGDNCVWKLKGRPVPPVLLRVRRHASGPQAQIAFMVERADAFGGGPEPVRVPGLGDEALYRDFEKVKGGALVVRRGSVVVTMSGSVSREAFVSLARLVVGRL